jgi:UDP-perosamine 4-acetyltransferase
MSGRLRGILILGGGGHAKGIVESLRLTHPETTLAIIDPGLAPGATVIGVAVLGGDAILGEATVRGFDRFVVGLGGIGDNRPRAALFERACGAGLAPVAAVHPAAMVAGSATIAPGAQVLMGAIIAAEARIERNAIINSGAIVEHDCRVGEHAHVATGAVLAGTVTVGAYAHIGASAVVRQGLSVGAEAVVGAGAVVTRPVPPRVTIVGVPGRIMESGGLKR